MSNKSSGDFFLLKGRGGPDEYPTIEASGKECVLFFLTAEAARSYLLARGQEKEIGVVKSDAKQFKMLLEAMEGQATHVAQGETGNAVTIKQAILSLDIES